MTLRSASIFLSLIILASMAVAEYGGGSWGAWLSSAYDARNTALGHSTVATADDCWASRSNPAGLGQLTATEARFTYGRPFSDVDDLSVGSIGVAAPVTGSFTPGTFALNISYLYAGGIPEADYGGTTGREFSDTDMEILLAWGKGFGEDQEAGTKNNFFVGTAFKIYSQKINDYRGKGFGMDVGVLSKPVPDASWAVNLRNFVQPGYRVNQFGDLAPTELALGGSARIAGMLCISLEGTVDTDLGYDASTGLELTPVPAISLRGGYQVLNAVASFGAGTRIGKVGLDYAAVLNPDLGLGHRLTFDLWF